MASETIFDRLMKMSETGCASSRLQTRGVQSDGEDGLKLMNGAMDSIVSRKDLTWNNSTTVQLQFKAQGDRIV